MQEPRSSGLFSVRSDRRAARHATGVPHENHEEADYEHEHSGRQARIASTALVGRRSSLEDGHSVIPHLSKVTL
jgi:hypothetical protein